MNAPDRITIGDVEYVRADTVPAPAPTGNRAVVVIDRGWIFAGDVTRENGRIRLSRVSWVFGFEQVGFAAVIADPGLADIRPFADIDVPDGAEIYSIPVHDQWGLK